MLGWFLPGALYRIGEPFVFAMMDERLREAFNFPRQSLALRNLVAYSLKTRGRIIRLLPPRREPRLLTKIKNRTYPHGYEIEQLGPPVEQQKELAATLHRDKELA